MANRREKPCWAATLTGSDMEARLATGTASIAWTAPEVIALVRVVSSGRICQVIFLARAGWDPVYLSLRSKTMVWLAAPLSFMT